MKNNSFIKSLNLLFIFLFINLSFVDAQERGLARIMFYNTENLFDTQDNPLTNDDEFLPSGQRNWTDFRLNNKLDKLAKVTLAVGGWEAPEIIGLCEIENHEVIEMLLFRTPLKTIPYKIVHKQSPDSRGIDVALLYRDDAVKPVSYEYMEVKDTNDPKFKTRDILYFSGIVGGNDTIHFFVNHWPSRYGGFVETIDRRKLAAQVLKLKVDQLKKEFHNPKIVVIGDFNDQPTDESLVKVLEVNNKLDSISKNNLYNLSAQYRKPNTGTHKFQSQWSIFDQIIVSGQLISNQKGIYTNVGGAYVFDSSFLLIKDEKYGGMKPHRTYSGFKYTGGFSDHLPVYLDLWVH